jgi:hypothetical protein
MSAWSGREPPGLQKIVIYLNWNLDLSRTKAGRPGGSRRARSALRAYGTIG